MTIIIFKSEVVCYATTGQLKFAKEMPLSRLITGGLKKAGIYRDHALTLIGYPPGRPRVGPLQS